MVCIRRSAGVETRKRGFRYGWENTTLLNQLFLKYKVRHQRARERAHHETYSMNPRLCLFTEFTLLMIALVGAVMFAGVHFTRSVSARPAELIAPFLYPPFYGRSTEESIFDHSDPTYSMTDNKIVTYQGETLNKACPSPAPGGIQPPNGLCDYGYGGYWSYQLGAYAFYNGHDGIDYGVSYRQVLAAADANQVVYAGWYNPQDHRSNLGIFVRLRHANSYDTWYGHMSALAVQSCTGANCASIPHDPNEIVRLDPHKSHIPYDWATKDR